MDPVRRRFEHFTTKELKALKSALEIWPASPEVKALLDDVLDEMGERFNELQEAPYVG